MALESKESKWKEKLHEVIYEADTPAGKAFDISLLFVILLSIALIMLESIDSFRERFPDFIYFAEWFITIAFTIEYILRIISIKRPSKFIFSFYGIIDLLSTIPTYLTIIFGGHNLFFGLRAFRLLRVFRILKMTKYVRESNQLYNA
ncbi:MAG TPA: ion transporter, partial [Salinimicrobium sp.]|nr:ion transporter [Salinimicrobium sp.]